MFRCEPCDEPEHDCCPMTAGCVCCGNGEPYQPQTGNGMNQND